MTILSTFPICRDITNAALSIPVASLSSLSKIFSSSNSCAITKTRNVAELSTLMLMNIKKRSIVSLTPNSLLSSISLSSFNKTNNNNDNWCKLIPVRHASYRKLKTHTGTKKRQRLRTGKQHLNTGVSRSRLRRLLKPAFANRTQRSRLLRLMPYSKTIKKMRRLSPVEIFSNVNAR
ncbi:7704_t:CDS:2 [Ambispora gerdemannii]|uniref:7704_t:CDS:1 n=1 Tax=Ambispora gerdemannii TaxID=144530 RepID=A0A9N8V2K7_9GLOM|nr:7704_t:CDS:2 [Ambispora gerdemannii]